VTGDRQDGRLHHRLHEQQFGREWRGHPILHECGGFFKTDKRGTRRRNRINFLTATRFVDGNHPPGRGRPAHSGTRPTLAASAATMRGTGIKVDSSGNAYIVGFTNTKLRGRLWDRCQHRDPPTQLGAGGKGDYDAFVAKFDGNGNPKGRRALLSPTSAAMARTRAWGSPS